MSRSNNIYFVLPFLVYLVFLYSIFFKLFNGIISINDNPFIWPQSSFYGLSTWSYSYLGMDRLSVMMVQIYFFLCKNFITIFNSIGFEYAQCSYIINFIPIYICCLTYYFISYKLTHSFLFSYFSGFFIILNNFVLEHLIIWPGVVFLSLISYALTIYLLHLIMSHGVEYKYLLLLILLSLLHFSAFFFIINFLLILLFIIYLLVAAPKLMRFAKRLIILPIGILLVHLYWIIPFALNLLLSTSSEVYSGNQAGVFAGYLRIAGVISLINLFHYPYYPPLSMQLHHGYLQYLFYFFLLIFIFIFLVLNTKINLWELFLFISLLFFFNLALGPNSIITGSLWLFFYDHIPGFGFFRSFTRFIILYVPIIIFILSNIFSGQFTNRKNALAILLFLLFISNSIFFTGNLIGYINSESVPSDYFQINNKYFNDREFSSILSLPNMKYERYIWSDINNESSKGVQSESFMMYFFSKPVIFNCYSVNLDQKYPQFKQIFSYVDNLRLDNLFDLDMDQLNVKYILIHKDILDITNNDDALDYARYISYLSNNTNYAQIYSCKYFTLFKKLNFNPLILLSNGEFKQTGPTRFTLYLKGINGSQKIEFNQKFNVGWKMFLSRSPNYADFNKLKIYSSSDILSAIIQPLWLYNLHHLYFGPSIDRSIMSNDSYPIYDGQSSLNYNQFIYKFKFPLVHPIDLYSINPYPNTWTIDPKYIKTHFSDKYYKINQDGSIDLELDLYYWPQSVFILSLISSCVFILFAIIYLTFFLFIWK